MKRLLQRFVACLVLLAPGVAHSQSGKPIVAIYRMDDVARTGLTDTFSTMIETAIASTGKFRVIERRALGTLLTEQGNAKAGLVTSRTPGKIGGFEGADFLIYGSITSVSAVAKQDIGTSILAGMLSGSSGRDQRCGNLLATLGVDIKITDAASGEVRYVSRINETQKSATVCNGQGNIDTGALMRSAADRIATALVTAIYPIQVAAVQPDGIIVLNYGQGAIQPGATMTIFSKGEAIRDPATGEVIGNNETRLGFLRITDVGPRLSKAVAAVTMDYAPQVGAIVRPATPEDIAALQALTKSARKHR